MVWEIIQLGVFEDRSPRANTEITHCDTVVLDTINTYHLAFRGEEVHNRFIFPLIVLVFFNGECPCMTVASTHNGVKFHSA